MGYPLPHETALGGPFAPMRSEATVEERIVSRRHGHWMDVR
jgi:carotenoid cleavage dioxygenase